MITRTHRLAVAVTILGSALAVTSCLQKPVALLAAPGKEARTQPVELGKVEWLRGFDAAQVTARELDKPLLTLFQEVPG